MHRNISRGVSKHLKIRNNFKTLSTASPKENENIQVKNDSDKEKNVCLNPLGIQMLSPGIHSQVFKNIQRPYDCNRPLTDKEQELVKVSLEHLKKHNLGTSQPEVLPEVDFKLPKLFGKTIDEHFKKIAEDYISKYLTAAKKLAANSLPPQPKKWNYQVGWTKYLSTGEHSLVDFPSDDALVLDVEVCVSSGLFPTLAVAVSQHAWYSWCSESLCKEQFVWSQKIHLKDLIPLETKVQQTQLISSFLKERIIIGHNVSYDRARIKEQYFLKASKIRFLDTMSMHIAISGLTSYQRALLTAKGKNTKDIQEAQSKMSKSSTTDWMHVSSLNSLAEVYKFYCGETLMKEKRDVFVNGTINDVRKDFQALMSYCASDVYATHAVFQKLLPIFSERFPHPVTLAGMLEMSTAYLPVNNNWDQYLEMAQTMYDDLEKEMKMYLMHLADDACELFHEERYKNDVWLKDLDWSTKVIKFKKTSTKSKSTTKKTSGKSNVTENEENNESFSYNKLASDDPPEIDLEEDKEYHIPKNIQTILNTSQNMYKVRPVLPGYPNWYRELCVRPTDDDSWSPGPFLISTQMQIAPKLLRLKWDGHPLYYDKKHGWGYLVAKKEDSECTIEDSNTEIEMTSNGDIDGLWKKLEEGIGDQVEISKMWYHWNKKKNDKKTKNKVTEKPDQSRPVTDVEIPGYVFYRLPHKDGEKHRVGNPLAKDFLTKIESGILQAGSGIQAEMVLKLSKMLSYWRNAHKRIKSQMVIWLNKSELSNHVTLNSSYEETNSYGAILPQIITAGTLTRRAVESTWLTASNAYPDRLGSELKSMIQAPPGFNFVGADVDSEELWIASVFGDAHFTGIHGCTAFGWMTLQGKKNDGTDMHSRTANTVGITRNQAKVLNYGRIYGAGQPFAQQLLMQFNPRLSEKEARTKAQIMFSATKGFRGYILNENGEIIYKQFKDLKEEKIKSKIIFTRGEILQMLIACNSPLKIDDIVKKTIWMGGTESEMFNKLEEIAQSDNPQTPVLSCRISQALEPAFVNNSFMTSRINWVVQSSAVDYLHMLLTAMHWLCITYKIQARFSISIHDEVRYLVKDSDKYRAALALQIANLLTRSMFAYQLKMYDLPQSVAFFSSVEIDTVLRKEVTMDCKTPSNPHGLLKGYGIDAGEALDIYEILLKTNGSLKKK